MTVPTSFFRSKTSQRLRAEGHTEGRAEDILRILDRRSIDVTPEARDRITNCHDLDVLGDWLDRTLTATVVDDLFHDTES
ncbi:hypothetical protein [Streptomyces solicavernae]|uniref:hypothetical protein n=1 Tax=Streptomyces solicavernae TaxID=3043614 RepID=UPI0032B7515A